MAHLSPEPQPVMMGRVCVADRKFERNRKIHPTGKEFESVKGGGG